MRMHTMMCLAFSVCLSPLLMSGCASSVGDSGAPFNPRMSTDGGFTPPPPPAFDMGPVDLRGATPCSAAPQGGCPAGQKCTSYDYVTTRCEVDGRVARGAHCAQVPDDCLAGMLCLDESTGGTLTQCRPFCATDAHCGNGSYCEIPLGGNLRLCTNPCDPLQSGSCQSGLGCYLYGSERSDCVRPGTRPINSACSSFADCQPGLMCIPKGASGVCKSVCKMGGTGCAGFEICTGITDGSYTWRTFGVCCPSGGC